MLCEDIIPILTTTIRQMDAELQIAPTRCRNSLADFFGQVLAGIVVVHRRNDFSVRQERQGEPFYQTRLTRIDLAAPACIPRVVVVE